MTAYLNAFPGNSETTVHATEPYLRRQEWACRNYFAYSLFYGGKHDAARKQFRIIGKTPTQFPWHSLHNYKHAARWLGFATDDAAPAGSLRKSDAEGINQTGEESTSVSTTESVASP